MVRRSDKLFGRTGGYGLGAYPRLRDGDGGPGVAGAERIPRGWERSGEGQRPAVPSEHGSAARGPVQCRERLGGLLRYYHREAA